MDNEDKQTKLLMRLDDILNELVEAGMDKDEILDHVDAEVEAIEAPYHPPEPEQPTHWDNG